MSIRYAILGLLSWKPFSGYDLKKVFADTPALYWSGNNNQIYTTLIKLYKEKLVSQQIQPQESLPTKKIYSITEKGLSELKTWVLSPPELPEYKNLFLIQLAWAALLDNKEIDTLLARYEEEIQMQLLLQKEKNRRKSLSPERTACEVFFWEKIAENLVSTWENELSWIRKVRTEFENTFLGTYGRI